MSGLRRTIRWTMVSAFLAVSVSGWMGDFEISRAEQTLCYDEAGLETDCTTADQAHSMAREAVWSPAELGAPHLFAAHGLSAQSVMISWRELQAGQSGFIIERNLGKCTAGEEGWVQVGAALPETVVYTDEGLTPDTWYSYRLRSSYEGAQTSEPSNCVYEQTGAAGSPRTPTDLRAYSVSDNQITLTWKDNSVKETEFRIGRLFFTRDPGGTTSGSAIRYATVGPNVTRFCDVNASGNTSRTIYRYVIRACRGDRCSAESEQVAVPFAPANLEADPTDFVNLTWTDTSPNETGFMVYRRTLPPGAENLWSLLATVGARVTSYLDNSATFGQTYRYRVRAATRSLAQPYTYGYSSWSNEVEAVK